MANSSQDDQPVLALPGVSEGSSEVQGKDGSWNMKLDHLGPIVVNEDGKRHTETHCSFFISLFISLVRWRILLKMINQFWHFLESAKDHQKSKERMEVGT
eukprot:TRINITY_DN20615_c0_g1_i1.p1 TRINITY_DN20615_c0_g1~~TRINITY_DN20615_c0_g1_i1.p1  ORF type:complete len:100 (+),score=18.90 TRINITY_DN20615_c0_g1_i1:84-383(+)